MIIKKGEWFSVHFKKTNFIDEYRAIVARARVPELHLDILLNRIRPDVESDKYDAFQFMNIEGDFLATNQPILTQTGKISHLVGLLPISIEGILTATSHNQLYKSFQPILRMQYKSVVYSAELIDRPLFLSDSFDFGDRWKKAEELEYNMLFFDPNNLDDIRTIRFQLLY